VIHSIMIMLVEQAFDGGAVKKARRTEPSLIEQERS